MYYSMLKKHEEFVNNLMGEKPIESINGINSRNKLLFYNCGFEKAYQLLAQFLLFSKNRVEFDLWLCHEFHQMTDKDRGDCIECLTEWCEKNL